MVEPLAATDVAEAAAVLTRAFRDNPGMCALFKGDPEATRARLIGPCMVGFVESVLRHGVAEVVKDEGKIAAVSLSFPPDGFPPPFWATVVQSKGPIRAGLTRALRFARIDQQLRVRHPHYRHWYLWFLGVEPEQQGRGRGSELLRSLSGKADAGNVASYLETDKATSVKIYERHGYVVESEEVLLGLDLRLWFMKRPER